MLITTEKSIVGFSNGSQLTQFIVAYRTGMTRKVGLGNVRFQYGLSTKRSPSGGRDAYYFVSSEAVSWCL